jgi:hypothetical protein
MIATAPAKGASVAAVMGIPGVGSRDNADQLLSRMVKGGEIVRVGRGRYGPVRPRPPRDVAAPPQPVAPNGVNEAPEVSPQSQSAPAVTTDAQGREWYTSVSYEHVRLDPTKITGEQWVLIGERYYREDGAWLWGWPRPGLPGCASIVTPGHPSTECMFSGYVG